MRLTRMVWSIVLLGVAGAVAAGGVWAGLEPRKAIDPADQAAARKVLLTVSDLPRGWKLQPPSTDNSKPPTPKCGQLSFSDLTETADVSKDYGKGAAGIPIVSSAVGMLKTRAQALSMWRRLPSDKTMACAARSGNGLPKGAHVTFHRLNVPPVGERSAGWRFEIKAGGFDIFADILFAMRGRTFATLSLADLGQPFDPAFAHRLALKAGARLDRYAR